MASQSERRRGQRVEANLRLKVRLPAGSSGTVADLETINISTSGAYFRSDHYIAPMTKLAMELELAVPGTAGAENGMAVLSCEGLVVRTIPEDERAGQESYEIAVFFTNTAPAGLRILEDHISLLLSRT